VGCEHRAPACRVTRCYIGTTSGSYSTSIDVGKVTTYTVPGWQTVPTILPSPPIATPIWRAAFPNEVSTTLGATDTTPPAVSITIPTSPPPYNTGSSTINVGGSASDNVGVTQVTWTNSRGGSGTATGTTSGRFRDRTAERIQRPDCDRLGMPPTIRLGDSHRDLHAAGHNPPAVSITIPTSATTYNTGSSTSTSAGRHPTMSASPM